VTGRADKQIWALGQDWLGVSTICKQHLLYSLAPFQKGSPQVYEKYPGEK